MATVRIIVTLKPGILDAQGQAVLQGLHALGYEVVTDVKVGRYLELTVPDGLTPEEINRMCGRFLANPLIEEWRILRGNAESRERGNATESLDGVEARGPGPGARQFGRRPH